MPIVIRRAAGAVYLVGGAAGPLGGDDLELEVVVGDGARLTVRTVAASIVLPDRSARWSRTVVNADVGIGASLDWGPQPLVACHACRHRAEAAVTLARDACLAWRDETVLGRHGEGPGHVVVELAVTSDAGPLLRHELEVEPSTLRWSSPVVLGGAEAVGTLVAVGCDVPPPPEGGWPARARWLALDAGGAMFTALGDPVAVRASLDAATPRMAAGLRT